MLEALHRETIKLSMRNLRQREVFRYACQALNAHNIPVIALKGIVFGTTLYPSHELKPMADIDLLVTDEDLCRAAEVLLQYGFSQPKLSENAFTSALRDQLPPFVYKGVAIELHRHIISASVPGQLPANILWHHSQPFTESHLPGVFRFNQQLTLFYLCYHIYIHRRGGYIKLIWLFDLYFYVKKELPAIDWQGLTDLADKAGMPSQFYEGLAWARDMLGLPVPQGVIPPSVHQGNYARLLTLTMPDKRGEIVSINYLRNLPLAAKIKFTLSKLFPNKSFVVKYLGLPSSQAMYKLYPRLYWRYFLRVLYRFGLIRQKPWQLP